MHFAAAAEIGIVELVARRVARGGLRRRLAPETRLFEDLPRVRRGLPLDRGTSRQGDECRACSSGGDRQLIFRWDGQRFVPDAIIDVPPR